MFLNEFSDVASVIKEFEAPDDALEGAEVLLAWYGYGSYDGSALVVYKKDGKLFEVNGGHCSCYGLEGQWDPEETTPEALLKRAEGMIRSGYSDGEAEAGVRLKDFAAKLSGEQS